MKILNKSGKILLFVLLPILIAVIVLFVSLAVCLYNIGKCDNMYWDKMQTIYGEEWFEQRKQIFKSFGADNTKKSVSDITVSYELEELENYFVNLTIFVENENTFYTTIPGIDYTLIMTNEELPLRLTLTEIDSEFPIEILREEGYAVYNVKQGGHYYVFFDVLENDGVLETEPKAVSTLYLNNDFSVLSYITKAFTTKNAQDMIDISYDTVITFNLVSNCDGICSYSYLNEIFLLKVYYEIENTGDDIEYKELTVKKYELVSRDSYSLFDRILKEDLP